MIDSRSELMVMTMSMSDGSCCMILAVTTPYTVFFFRYAVTLNHSGLGRSIFFVRDSLTVYYSSSTK